MIPLSKYLNWDENRALYVIALGSLILSLVLAAGMMQTIGRIYQSGKFHFMETDLLFLRNGDEMPGRIVSETPERVTFEFRMGTVDFSREEIKDIKRDYYAHLFRELW